MRSARTAAVGMLTTATSIPVARVNADDVYPWSRNIRTATMLDLGEVLDPFRKQVIDVKDALARARYLYDGLDLILENVEDSKIRGASQEVFSAASERMDTIDAMLDEFYRQLSSADRTLENYKVNPKG
jgi:hypothetical protein